MTGVLYICGTPIGNLEDITFRVVRILSEVDLIAAEDTRHTRKILNHYDIKGPMTSFHAHNQRAKAKTLLSRIAQGDSVALVTDAGMPGISDPGAELVSQAVEAGLAVQVVPGPSAVVAAIAVSGLRTDRFVFEGYLPRKGRKQALESYLFESRTVVFFESPQRLVATLQDIAEVLGERNLVVARELTKQYEDVYRGSVSAAQEHFTANPPRGEITVLLGGSSEKKVKPVLEVGLLQEEVAALQQQKVSRAEALQRVAKRYGVSRRQLYQLLLEGSSKEG